MKKIFLWAMAVIVPAILVLEVPSAYAIFGIRLARKAIAAHKAEEMTSSPTPEEAYAQEKARFAHSTGNGTSSRMR